MTAYSLTQNRTASDMDGIGTDLATTDTVVTNAFKLTLDIDCRWRKITVSSTGELQVDGHTYIVDDYPGGGIDAQAGSVISGPNLTKTAFAVFKSAAGIGCLPLRGPWMFRVLGTMSLKYCRAYGHKWSMRNATYLVEFPFGCTKFAFNKAANLVRNNIQGADEAIKWTGSKQEGGSLTGILFDNDTFLQDYLLAITTSGETLSLVTERFFSANVKLSNVSINPGPQDVLRFSVGAVEVD